MKESTCQLLGLICCSVQVGSVSIVTPIEQLPDNSNRLVSAVADLSPFGSGIGSFVPGPLFRGVGDPGGGSIGACVGGLFALTAAALLWLVYPSAEIPEDTNHDSSGAPDAADIN